MHIDASGMRILFESALHSCWFPTSTVGGTQGTLLFDYGTDLNTGSQVLGDPAGVRGKPGSGYGYGIGIRIDSPVGPLRLEYAWNKNRQSRVHLGIGSHG